MNRLLKSLIPFNSAYKVLHLWGYYDGIEKADIVKSGFDEAYKLIKKIEPAGLNGTDKRTTK